MRLLPSDGLVIVAFRQGDRGTDLGKTRSPVSHPNKLAKPIAEATNGN